MLFGFVYGSIFQVFNNMTKKAKPKVKTDKQATIMDYNVPEGFIVELNFFDLTGEKAHTSGTSNKAYHLELQVSKDDKLCQLYSEYGPTGKVAAKDWRYFGEDRASAEEEFQSIKKSKIKKGYKEIDVAQRVLGSTEAQKKIKAVVLKNVSEISKPLKSSLSDAQKSIVSLFFNAQDTWVSQVLKCPLGQLTNKQIDLGRDTLDKAKLIVNSAKGSLSKSQINQIDDLTNDFYGLIPHNLGSGARGQMTHLRLDSLNKIVEKEGDLDTLLDAKQVNTVVNQDSTIDDKYKSLNCDFGEVPIDSSLFQFLTEYFEGSKVSGHGYGSSKITRIWTMLRRDAKEAAFLCNSERIAKESGKHTFAEDTSNLSFGKSKLWTPENRPDLDNDHKSLFQKANVWLCWHGTRSANLVGITRRGLLIRPTGAVYTGSLFGDGKYFAWQSTKSLNYCDGGYWTGGGRGHTQKRYMFLLDCAFGNLFHSKNSQFFTTPPKGYHSVYGKSGYHSSLRNDEMITYDKDDLENQSSIRYLFEITG